MAVLREFWHRLRGVLRRNPADPDLERELRFHLELAEEELRARGHSRAEVARMARVRLGGVPQALEALRDQRGLPWLDDLRTDVRIGLRGLARRPGFTATAARTLSIGIGATAAVATWTNGLLFQPLPVPDAEELVMVAQLDEHTAEFPHELSYPEYLDCRELGDVFEGLAAYAMAEGLLSIDGGAAERIRPSWSGAASRGGRRWPSMLLLVCAGLFVQSSRNADATDFGFRTDDLLVLSVDPLAQGYDRDRARVLYREIAAEVDALPGVRSASWARRAPVRPGGIWGRVFTRDGGTAPEPDAARVAKNYVDPAFFDTVGLEVLQGRGFREEDGASDRRVAVVSERAARELWPGQDAVGRRIVDATTGGAPFEVIGVAGDRTCRGRRSSSRRSSSIRSGPVWRGRPRCTCTWTARRAP